MHRVLLSFLLISCTTIAPNSETTTEPPKKDVSETPFHKPGASVEKRKKRRKYIIGALASRAGKVIPRRARYVCI